MYTVYRPPDGRPIKSPKRKTLRDLIYHRGEDYWQNNAGSGSIVVGEYPLLDEQGALGYGPDTRVLGLTLKEPYGFLLMFSWFGQEEEVAISERKATEKVTVFVGDAWTVPTSCFFHKEDAWKAVEEFLQTGERPKNVTWVMVCEQRW